MPTATTHFPNGDTLTTTALTPPALHLVLQPLTCRRLGRSPETHPLAYSKVRLDWPTGGQPAWGINDDVCFLKVSEEDDPYNRIRDRRLTPNDAVSVTTTITYTRVWRVSWSFYGPTSFDAARLVKSALLNLDFPADTLQAANLSLVTDLAATTRNPEKFQGQWWERTDLTAKLNELVTETLTVAIIASAEVMVATESGPVADFTI